MSTVQKLNSEPEPQFTTDGKLVKMDGEPVLKVLQWSPLTVRAVSMAEHLSPGPSYEIRDGQVIAWQGEHREVIGDLMTDDDARIEYLKARLHAKRTN